MKKKPIAEIFFGEHIDPTHGGAGRRAQAIPFASPPPALLSACWLVVRLLSALKADNNRTTSGQQADNRATRPLPIPTPIPISPLPDPRLTPEIPQTVTGIFHTCPTPVPNHTEWNRSGESRIPLSTPLGHGIASVGWLNAWTASPSEGSEQSVNSFAPRGCTHQQWLRQTAGEKQHLANLYFFVFLHNTTTAGQDE